MYLVFRVLHTSQMWQKRAPQSLRNNVCSSSGCFDPIALNERCLVAAMQDPDKFIEQADQEQQELRQKLEAATERIKTIEVLLALLLFQYLPQI